MRTLKDSINLQRNYWSPRKRQAIRKKKIIKLVRDLTLCAIYFVWIVVVLDLLRWVDLKCVKKSGKCRKQSKNVDFDFSALFTTEIGTENLIYFLPLIV